MKVSQRKKNLDGSKLKVGIVMSRFNDKLGDHLLKNCVNTLQKNAVKEKNISIIEVPGALETPIAAQALAKTRKPDVIIALGVVIKGDTHHFELVCNESHRGLMHTALHTQTPVIFGIITAYNQKQAQERVLATKHNKGKEFAESAIEIASALNKLNRKKFDNKSRHK